MAKTTFKALHEQDSPLLLGNVWDAHSAKLAESAGFKALGSSSHAIANMLGYEDGEEIGFEELLFVVERIVKAVKIPVSVDFEAGYATDPRKVARYARQLADAGVVGINIEDGVVEDGKRKLGSAEGLAAKISAIKAETDLFINARPDTYTTKHADALGEAIARAKAYHEAGADGIFVPLIEKAEDIRAFTEAVSLPLNVFMTPDLPKYDELAELGVKRISNGAKLYEWLVGQTEAQYKAYREANGKVF